MDLGKSQLISTGRMGQSVFGSSDSYMGAINRGTPKYLKMDGLFPGHSQSKMDDLGVPLFRKPPHVYVFH